MFLSSAVTADRSSAMSPARDAVRIVNKFVPNPVMMRLAGRKRWYAVMIPHTGRHTGTDYATPVVAEPVPDGFIIPLPYGRRLDWLRNVFKAGHARLLVNGHTLDVIEPEILDA